MPKRMTNPQVGHLLLNGDQDYDGSNLYIRRVNHARDSLGFLSLAFVASYNTEIAHLVHNEHTDTRELWVTENRYSSTTDQHMRHLLQGMRAQQRGREPTLKEYQFKFNPHIHRCAWTLLSLALRAATTTCLPNVVKKGVHERTRYAALGEAIDGLERAVHVATDNLPWERLELYSPLSAEKVREARELLAMLTPWKQLPVAELRAAAGGYLALEREGR